jgi:diacylglycerol kinase (ATP)
LKSIGVLINPTSGKGKGALAGQKVLAALDELGQPYRNLTGGSLQQSRQNAQACIEANELNALLVVGGDGMVHLGANLCGATEVPLGIIAAGTGNDSAMTMGLPLNDPAAAVRVAVDSLANPVSIDLISGKASLGDFYAFGTVSAGFDALVNARANRMSWPRGQRRYEVAMVLELLKFKGIHYKAVIDGVERKISAMLCAVANAPSFGGGMLIAPHADLSDGKLDLFIVHKITRATLLKIFPTVYTGKHVTHPAVEFVEAKTVVLDAGDMAVYADGEYVGQSPVETKVASQALKVLAPSR